MCYSVYFSTDSSEDLAKSPSVFYSVCPFEVESDSQVVDLLGYTQRRFLESRYGGCSCHFRHSMTEEFGPVEDWDPEDADDVEATEHFYDLLSRILAEGHRLDIVDIWTDTPVQDVRSIDVFLHRLPRDQFRFLEGIRFELKP
jgi:hypothetical protein